MEYRKKVFYMGNCIEYYRKPNGYFNRDFNPMIGNNKSFFRIRVGLKKNGIISSPYSGFHTFHESYHRLSPLLARGDNGYLVVP